MKENEIGNKAPRREVVRISLAPGASWIKLLAAAVEKSIRSGAGLVSLEHFPRADYRLTPVLVQSSGKFFTPPAGAAGRRDV